MNKELIDKLQDFLEDCGWFYFQYDEKNQTVEFRIDAPNDGNHYIEATTRSIDDFMDDIKSNVEFDVDEYVYLWLQNKRMGDKDIPSARCIVEDGEHIQKELNELYNNLTEFFNTL